MRTFLVRAGLGATSYYSIEHDWSPPLAAKDAPRLLFRLELQDSDTRTFDELISAYQAGQLKFETGIKAALDAQKTLSEVNFDSSCIEEVKKLREEFEAKGSIPVVKAVLASPSSGSLVISVYDGALEIARLQTCRSFDTFREMAGAKLAPDEYGICRKLGLMRIPTVVSDMIKTDHGTVTVDYVTTVPGGRR